MIIFCFQSIPRYYAAFFVCNTTDPFFHQTHRIFSFHPSAAKLQDLEVTAPWQNSSTLYPAPHAKFLRLHFTTSIANSLKASPQFDLLDDPEEDGEEMFDVDDHHSSIWGDEGA
jgi:hypothetical protein